ncbi:uncharacterized protein LOC142568579 [Dermacentor variabilis]|uniref:uncharacterized protein LOC142568579 n=1 Tax=Dermacentor variabilis TaxID=34621 RepID=UPI003F5BD889
MAANHSSGFVLHNESHLTTRTALCHGNSAIATHHRQHLIEVLHLLAALCYGSCTALMDHVAAVTCAIDHLVPTFPAVVLTQIRASFTYVDTVSPIPGLRPTIGLLPTLGHFLLSHKKQPPKVAVQ